MTHSEIAKQTMICTWQTTEDFYHIIYTFGEHTINFRLFKDSDSDLLALVNGEMCQFEALSIAIMNEVQKEAKATEHRAGEAVNNLHPLFQDILKPFVTPKNI